MRDANPIRTLGDYSKPSHEGYRNTIELPKGNNVVPLRPDTIRERTRLRLFQFSLRNQASNWLERLPAGSISTWKDLTTRFLAQFFPPGRTAKLCNDILMFQQHQGESLSEGWTRFKDSLLKVPHHGTVRVHEYVVLALRLQASRDPTSSVLVNSTALIVSLFGRKHTIKFHLIADMVDDIEISPSGCLEMKVLVLLALVEIVPNPLAASIGSVSALDFSGKNLHSSIRRCGSLRFSFMLTFWEAYKGIFNISDEICSVSLLATFLPENKFKGDNTPIVIQPPCYSASKSGSLVLLLIPSHEYLNDLEEEYQARALLAKSKRFFKKGTQRFSSAKATDQTECHKCGKKGDIGKPLVLERRMLKIDWCQSYL
ncbi:zinc finger, CCHC-type containing protein [Tanacetum coccineum]